MTRKTLISAACVIIAGAAMVSAQEVTSTAAPFLQVGVGMRGAAMGEAFSPLAEGIESLNWNPAGIVNMDGFEASILYSKWVQDTSYTSINLGLPLGSAAIAGGVNFLTYPTIEMYNGPLPTDKVGETTPKDMVAMGGFGIAFDEEKSILVGALGKFFSETIVDTSYSTIALDFGVSVEIMPNELYIGAAAQNMIGKIKEYDIGES